ncbi:MAG: hypothetical protein JJV91_00845 [Desulfosarcina sp.]|nr:hypothetical protein [Desulfobacterales bacterium]
MNTAPVYYKPNESGGNTPDYLIPDHVPFEPAQGSNSDYDGEESTTDKNPSPELLPVALAPPLSPLKGRYTLLQRWDGHVVKVRDFDFDAIIIDKTNPNLANELVTIEKIEISPDDFPLLENGSVFYWSIGYSDYPGRGRIRESKIRFRRLKGWTKKEIDHSKTMGKQFAEFFKSDSVCSAKF